MTELRVSEVKAMEEEINRLFDDLEREKYESEVELKRQLQARACFRESSKGACQLRDINVPRIPLYSNGRSKIFSLLQITCALMAIPERGFKNDSRCSRCLHGCPQASSAGGETQGITSVETFPGCSGGYRGRVHQVGARKVIMSQALPLPSPY